MEKIPDRNEGDSSPDQPDEAIIPDDVQERIRAYLFARDELIFELIDQGYLPKGTKSLPDDLARELLDHFGLLGALKDKKSRKRKV